MTEPDAKPELSDEVRALHEQVTRLNEQVFFQRQNSFWRTMGWNLARGISFGLGSVLGATVIVAVVVRFLGSIDFIPVIGDWATQIIDDIDSRNTR